MTATENNDGILPKIYVIYNRRKTKKGKKKIYYENILCKRPKYHHEYYIPIKKKIIT